jgi:integrase/recombinase XerD
MAVCSGCTTEAAVAAFDEHLRRVRGVCEATRASYTRFVRMFLDYRFPDGEVELGCLVAQDMVAFVGVSAVRYQPRSLELVASSLRSFLRFLRAEGVGGVGLEHAVPGVRRQRSGLVRHLDQETLERLIGSLDGASPRGLRDRAMILFVARLGLRASEVRRLRLDDIDWDQGLIRVAGRKTGHGARLPLTAEVGAALADYLQHGRPDTAAREVFVLLRQRPGAPLGDSVVRAAVGKALRDAGIDVPRRGANLLRHSLATGLQARGVSLGEIAGLLGHRCLATTRIYAAVDVEALRQVALPWPAVRS